jgi:cytochrome c5
VTRTLLFLALPGLVACAGTLIPRVRDADVARVQAVQPDVSRAALERGRSLYLAKCTSCHQPYTPASRPLEQWHKDVAEMSELAGLEPDEAQLILTYLGAFARP